MASAASHDVLPLEVRGLGVRLGARQALSGVSFRLDAGRRTVILGAKNTERGVVAVREGLERGVPVITVKAEGLKPGANAVVKVAKPARNAA